MLDHVLNEYQRCSYDFRRYACRNDPLIDRFDEWVDYYRMKWAIAKALRPSRILEIGVRYGYSARAFLDAASGAKYVGLDADASTFGGTKGALEWARQALKAYDAELILADSQKLLRLPGGFYDLVHVDGQQDGDGTFHDMNLALTQGRYILLDGYFWSRENFLAANEWMLLNKAAIEWAVVIPGHAGELLIRTNLQASDVAPAPSGNSQSLFDCYTERYYLTDCGGYADWLQNRGIHLGDSRLRAVAEVAWALTNPKRVIDLGAGRGELTRHFANAGVEVTAVDYSKNAIALIEKTVSRERDGRSNVKMICDSVTNPAIYEGVFDAALASDVVEHLSPAELDALYSLVAKHLRPESGVMVIHTAPNLWNYRYEHARQQQAAKKAGGWLPKTRRTYFERLMHINEQSPRVLRRQLKRHFAHVQLWFSGPDHLWGSLLKRYRMADMRRATSLFAVASHRPIDVDAITTTLRMDALPKEAADRITLRVSECPEKIEAASRFTVRISLFNGTGSLLTSYPPHPFYFSYHWENSIDGSAAIFDGLRSRLAPPCRPGATRTYEIAVQAPPAPGRYTLKVVPVQEEIRWHESANETRQVVDVVSGGE